MRIAMKSTKFSKFLDKCKADNAAFVSKLNSGNITKQDAEAYKKMVDEYFDQEATIIIQ
jgi:hypothetical protein